jgi:hypothetical protein
MFDILNTVTEMYCRNSVVIRGSTEYRRVVIGRNHSTLHSMQEALAALSIYKSVLLFVLL